MVLSTRLQIKQTQSLVITPQLLQAIRLLQMSSVELEAFVASELEQNPLLQQMSRTAATRRIPLRERMRRSIRCSRPAPISMPPPAISSPSRWAPMQLFLRAGHLVDLGHAEFGRSRS
jgi:RNA polymerase sigma-54 factor